MFVNRLLIAVWELSGTAHVPASHQKWQHYLGGIFLYEKIGRQIENRECEIKEDESDRVLVSVHTEVCLDPVRLCISQVAAIN